MTKPKMKIMDWTEGEFSNLSSWTQRIEVEWELDQEEL